MQVFKHQADATLSQANPVSGTYYTVLATKKNVRLICASANITWAVTQPTLLTIKITIDGVVKTHNFDNPVSAQNYEAYIRAELNEANQRLTASSSTALGGYRAFLYEGRSIKVEVAVTWAVTQPTPLVCRVKYAKC